MRHYRNYSDGDIVRLAKESDSVAGLLKKLNLRPTGGNYINIKRNLQRLNVDCSHWTYDRGWSRGQQLKDWSKYTRVANLKKHLKKSRGVRCESCFLEKWKDCDIPLEVHHIDGDRTNNEINNLQLLCPNCHYLTDNFRNRKRVSLNR